MSLAVVTSVQAQQQQQPSPQSPLAQEFEQQYVKEKRQVDSLAKIYDLEVTFTTEEGRYFELMRFENNHPVYYATDNVDAQATIAVDEVQPGGVTGYDLTGEGITLGEWDGGAVRTTHQEFGDRVNQADNSNGLSGHATHVAGIIMAAGVRSEAEGMSYNANLDAHDWGNANSEMATAAENGLVVSNHSYGIVVGWGGRRSCKSGSDEQFPVWHGNTSVSETEDYRFGFYTNGAERWDRIAHENPHYLIVKSAGNDRGNSGPPESDPGHCVNVGGSWQYSEKIRQPDGGDNGFDSMGSRGNAKNILAVGAVRDIPGGYDEPSDVQASGFTSFGPPDDGRVKPDVVGNGVGLLSPNANSDDSYARLSGTSMSAPNVTGAIGLLHEFYQRLNNTSDPLRAATIKSLLIQTTNEAGNNPGPDYKYGWGLVNTRRAADLIQLDHKLDGTVIHELTLNQGDTINVPIEVNPDDEELNVTVGWTDPPANSPQPSLDPPANWLVNDVDMKLIGPDSEHYPWKLDGDNPSQAATKGENNVDNIEKATVSDPAAGEYVVQITHDGSLQNGSQDVSLILDRGAGERYDVTGRITIEGTNSQAAAGATVHLSGFAEDSVITDSAGYFTFNGLYNGDYTLNPDARGVTFTPDSIDFTVESADLSDIDFLAQTPGYRNVKVRLNTATLPDTLSPSDTVQLRGNVGGTSDAADQLPDGNTLAWDDQSTLTLQNRAGDYWYLNFQIPEAEDINFKFFSQQNQSLEVGGLESGSNHTIDAGIGHINLPLHYFEKNTEQDRAYDWLPWEDSEGQNVVHFRLYIPENLNPIIVGVRGNSFNMNGPLRKDQPRVDIAREVSDDTKPGYRLYSGVGYYDSTLTGRVQQYKFKFEFSSWTEASWRTFTIPDHDTTLHWTYPNNAFPILADDDVNVIEDSSVTFNPLVNDSDPENSPLSIAAVGTPNHGQVQILDDTLLTYQPDSNYSGDDQFTYTVQDTSGAQADADVSVTVQAVNDPPEYPEYREPADSITVDIDGEWDDTFTAQWDSVYDPDGDNLTYYWQLTRNNDFHSDSLIYTEKTDNNKVNVTYARIDSILNAIGVEDGQTAEFQHRIIVDDSQVQRISDTLTTYFQMGTITSLEGQTVEQPDKFKLRQNYPNPFNPTTKIRYSIPKKAHVTLTVYNTLGQQVAILVDKTLGAGKYQAIWSAGNQNSGMYLYRIEAGRFSDTKSMILLK